MEAGDKAVVEVGNQKIPFVFVGGGGTTLAFSEEGFPSVVYLFVADLQFLDGSTDEDMSKDVLAEAYLSAPGNKYLPQIEFLKRTYVAGPELNKNCKIYKMPFYDDIEQSDAEAWLEMKVLHKLRSDGKVQVKSEYRESTGKSPSLSFLGNNAAARTLELAKLKENKEMAQALEAMYKSIATKARPGMTFEFNKRNIGVDNDGRIVLRDPVYDSAITVKILKDRHTEREAQNANRP